MQKEYAFIFLVGFRSSGNLLPWFHVWRHWNHACIDMALAGPSRPLRTAKAPLPVRPQLGSARINTHWPIPKREKKRQDACLIWMLMFFVILFVIRLWILRISHPFGPLDSKAAHRNSDITQVWANGKSALRIGRLMILGCEVFRGI